MCVHIYIVCIHVYIHIHPRVCCYSPLPPFQGPDTLSLWHLWRWCIFAFLYIYMHVRFYLFLRSAATRLFHTGTGVYLHFRVRIYHIHKYVFVLNSVLLHASTTMAQEYVYFSFYVYVFYMCVHVYTCILKSLLLHASSTLAHVYMYIFACMYILYVCIHLYVSI